MSEKEIETKQSRRDNLIKLIGYQEGSIECYLSDIENSKKEMEDSNFDIVANEDRISDLEEEIRCNNHVLECMESDIEESEKEDKLE